MLSERDSNPWPCNCIALALTTELSSQLRTGHLWVETWNKLMLSECEPMTVRLRCIALPTELLSQQGDGHLLEEAWKKSISEQDSNLWPRKCPALALPTDLSSQLRAGHLQVRIVCRTWWMYTKKNVFDLRGSSGFFHASFASFYNCDDHFLWDLSPLSFWF